MNQAVDNTDLIAPFIDEQEDGDTFWYTEILDRTRSSAGSNHRRTLRMFHHTCRGHLLVMMPLIRTLCDATGARACIRLSPRSRKAVGKMMLVLAAEMASGETWASAPYLYARACGRTCIHGRKLWLYDVDEGQDSDDFLLNYLARKIWLRCVIPSRTGRHYIVTPHDPNGDPKVDIQLHKDNPTNLYIPANAEAVALA